MKASPHQRLREIRPNESKINLRMCSNYGGVYGETPLMSKNRDMNGERAKYQKEWFSWEPNHATSCIF